FLLEQSHDVNAKIKDTLDECAHPNPAIAKVQRAVVEHLEPRAERARAVSSRLETYNRLLSDPDSLFTGWGAGGGGGKPGELQDDADVKFSNYMDQDGKTKGTLPKDVHGSVLDIKGPGKIVASQGFKIICGGSSIELTPGSITLSSTGPIKLDS